MLLRIFCRPAGKIHPSRLREQVTTSSITVSEASLLLTTITNRLGDYATSLQEDTEILEKLEGGEELQIPEEIHSTRYGMAIRVRRGEKEILHHFLRLLQDFLIECNDHVAREGAKRKRDEMEQEPASKRAMHV
jgi:hypothetical protein